MGGLAGAWLAGVGIVAWRETKASGHMPVPAALLGVTLLFGALALIGDIAPRARPLLTLAGWGLDVAGLFQVLPGGLFGQVQASERAQQEAETPPGGTGVSAEAV